MMDGMKALPKPHVCDTPDTGLPGDEWTCPVCHRLWWADEVESEGGLFIEWRRVPDRPSYRPELLDVSLPGGPPETVPGLPRPGA